MRGHHWVLPVLYCITPLTARADGRWTVDDCISYAIEHNHNLQNKRINTRITGADVVSAYGTFLPSISAVGKSVRHFEYSAYPSTGQSDAEPFRENMAGLSVSLPVFEGFTRINRLKFVRLNKTISSLAEKVAENSLALEVVEAFYRHCFDTKVYELAMEQRRLGERYYEMMTEYVGLGLRPLSDISEFKARLQADIYQERVKADNCVFSLSALKVLMGMEEADTLTINLGTESESAALPDVNLNNLHESARTYLPEYQIMALRKKASHTTASIVSGALYPSVKMIFNINRHTAQSHNGPTQLFDAQPGNHSNRYIGISVSIPLLDGLLRYKDIQKEKMRLQQIKNDNERQRLLLSRDIYDTYISAQTAGEEWKLAKKQLRAAAVAWHKSEEKWEKGMISGFELMESRNLYMQARMETVRTSLQYMLKRKMILFYHTGSFI